jgi:pyrroline-5-carboxylate reductase
MSSKLGQKKVGIVGAGNMAEALIRGWLHAGLLDRARIRASDVARDRLEHVASVYGIDTHSNNGELIAWADVVVLAVKPQAVAAVLGSHRGAFGDALVISIAAGVPLRTIEGALGTDVRAVRAMPNTPALVLAGVTALSAGAHASEDDVRIAVLLFDAVGKTVVLPESALDAVTGLSGSGPAYVMLVIEALSDGGVHAGLSRDVANLLAVQTVYGAAKLLLESGEHPARLKDRVTSPGGTTIAGLRALESGGLRGALIDAVIVATERSAELGRKA